MVSAEAHGYTADYLTLLHSCLPRGASRAPRYLRLVSLITVRRSASRGGNCYLGIKAWDNVVRKYGEHVALRS